MLTAKKGTGEAAPKEGAQRSAAVGAPPSIELAVVQQRGERERVTSTLPEAVIDAELEARWGILAAATEADMRGRTDHAAKPGGEGPDGGAAPPPPPSDKPKKRRARGDDPDGRPDDMVVLGTRVRRDFKRRFDLYGLLTNRKGPRLLADALDALLAAEADSVSETTKRTMDEAGG